MKADVLLFYLLQCNFPQKPLILDFKRYLFRAFGRNSGYVFEWVVDKGLPINNRNRAGGRSLGGNGKFAPWILRNL